MAGNRRDHVPFLGRHVESNACAEDLATVLVLRRNLFKDQRRIVEHSQLNISTARKDMPLPLGFQGMADSWRKKKSAFVATQTTSKPPPSL